MAVPCLPGVRQRVSSPFGHHDRPCLVPLTGTFVWVQFFHVISSSIDVLVRQQPCPGRATPDPRVDLRSSSGTGVVVWGHHGGGTAPSVVSRSRGGRWPEAGREWRSAGSGVVGSAARSGHGGYGSGPVLLTFLLVRSCVSLVCVRIAGVRGCVRDTVLPWASRLGGSCSCVVFASSWRWPTNGRGG